MFFSRHQLNQALVALDEAQRTSPCQAPRRTDMQERWDHAGRLEVVDNPKPEFDHRERRTNADPLPDPHGRAFLTVDPDTLEVQCAACAAGGEK